nr:MAG TPA: Frequency clock protein [Caudoviricetes sp.]
MHNGAIFFLTGAKFCTMVNYRFANSNTKKRNLKGNLNVG